MLYINLDPDFFGHPKTKRLVGLLGRGAEMLPIKLWCYCGKYHAKDGRFTGYSTHEIESLVDWWGKPGDMIDAMVKVEFLVRREDGDYEIHDWLDHEGHIIALKDKAQKAARARWEKDKSSGKSQNKVDVCSSNAPGNAPGDSGNASSNAKGMLKQSSYLPTIPTIPTNSKSFNNTDPEGNFSTASPQVREVLKAVFTQGINIYELINLFHKRSGLNEPLPDEVIIDVARSYLERGAIVRNDFGWFLDSLYRCSQAYFAARNVKEHDNFKKDPVVIGSIFQKFLEAGVSHVAN